MKLSSHLLPPLSLYLLRLAGMNLRIRNLRMSATKPKTTNVILGLLSTGGFGLK